MAADAAGGAYEVERMSLYADSDYDSVSDELHPAPPGVTASVIVLDALHHPLLSQAVFQGLLGSGVMDAFANVKAAQPCDPRTICIPAGYVF